MYAISAPTMSVVRDEEIEIIRSIVSSLCYVAPNQAREIHTTTIKNAFSRASAKGGFKFGLAALQLVGEIQQLPNGYWIPTPVRAVPLDSTSIVVSSIPTHRLKHEIPGIIKAGISRLAPESSASQLNSQSLANWLNLTVSDTEKWAEREITKLALELRPTISTRPIEYFQLGDHHQNGVSKAHFRWTKIPGNELPIEHNLYLCREKIGLTGYIYSIVKLKSGRVIAEAPVPYRPTRLQYGIARLVGAPIVVGVKKGINFIEISVSESLPLSEFRFLEAVSLRSGRKARQRTYLFNDIVYSTFLKIFTDLGCEMGATND